MDGGGGAKWGGWGGITGVAETVWCGIGAEGGGGGGTLWALFRW